MSQADLAAHELTERQQETFRRDFQDKEREIQKYIGVYLSGLVIVTGWIIGPQSRPVLAMALGNEGYNVYAFLIFLALNVVFTNFLIYKSLTIHEITQFMTRYAKRDSPFLYWEEWRRGELSATRRTRTIYTISLSLLPVFVSALMAFGVYSLLYSDTSVLLDKYRVLESSSTVSAVDEKQSATIKETSATKSSLTPERLRAVFHRAKYWFFAVVLFHLVPLFFFYENVFPNNKRWQIIRELKRRTNNALPLNTTGELTDSANSRSNDRVGPQTIWLYNKATGKRICEIDTGELEFLKANLEEEHKGDQDYYLNTDALAQLREIHSTKAALIQKLEKNLDRKTHDLEIEWRME